MTLVIPENKNVAPVILPCVQREITNLYKINIESQVTQPELQEGEIVVREWYKPWVSLSQFPHAYYMGDGITKAIDLTRLEYADKSWTMLQGDYEWPMAFGKFNRKRKIEDLQDEVVYLTQPFAGTGTGNLPWSSHLPMQSCFLWTVMHVVLRLLAGQDPQLARPATPPPSCHSPGRPSA
jgi:hypothetical protein